MSYEPDHHLNVIIDFDDDGYSPPDALNLIIDLDDDESSSTVTYVNPTGLDAQIFGIALVASEAWSIRSIGFNSIRFGNPSFRNNSYFVNATGFNSVSFGYGRVFNRKTIFQPSGLNATWFGSTKVFNSTSYIRSGAYNFFASGRARVSYKEQHVTTKQDKNFSLFGNILVAYGVRYVEMNSSLIMSRFGMVWASHSPRFIEPRGIFQQFPSYHRVGGTQNVKMEGFDFLRFGTRIIPESQTIYPSGMSTIFGQLEVRNNLYEVKPKGFLGVGEIAELRFGHIDVFNSDQYIHPYHDNTSRAAGALFPDIRQHDVANRNRTIQTYGRLITQFGYADLNNNARVVYPVGLASPLEVDPTKTLVADGIRYIKPVSIEAPYFSAWHNIWLGAQAKTMQGPLLTLFGIPYVENTRRIYRFISFGEQTLFGKSMVSHAVRGIRIEEGYSIAPPVIPMPEVKLGVRYVEPRSIDSVRYGWPHLAEQFTKIAPHWVHVNRVGEPSLRNVTPQVRPWQFESAKYGTAYVGLYTRHIKPDGLNAQGFSRARISDRKQSVDLRGYGIQSLTITRQHKIEHIGAGILLPHVIYPYSMITKNFETDDKKLHKIYQNALQPESKQPMTIFGNTGIHANTIRVEPGYWENLIGKALIEHKNRTAKVSSERNDFLGIGMPRMSPHTIWAVMGAPAQAIQNHVRHQLQLHYVDGLNENGNAKEPGIEIGTPKISHKHRFLPAGQYDAAMYGKANIKNVVDVIAPKGLSTMRIGVIGPIGDQEISFRSQQNYALYGNHRVMFKDEYDGRVRPVGMHFTQIGNALVEHFHREVKPSGIDSLAMGTKKTNDYPYMWQGLRVGVHVPTRVGGDIHSQYGTPWISHRVREAIVPGNDFALVGEYTPGKFNLRMHIYNRTQPELPASQRVLVSGFTASAFGVLDIKPAVHFIRPDGNFDNYRKGAPNA